MKFIFFKSIKKLGFLTFVLIFSFFSELKIYSSENNIEKKSAFTYILGAGDILDINVYKSPEFNSKVKILSDGTINLVRVGSLTIDGLTIKQAKDLVEKEYKKILKYPFVTIKLERSRALRVSVLGEVNRPGFYTIDPEINTSSVLNSDGGEKIIESSKGWPTVVEALQRAGGITQNSNLKKISLTRQTPGNTEIIKKINFYGPLIKNEKLINPKIYDGDIIFVPKAKALLEKDLSKVSSSNLFAPTITVSIIGEVTNPGQYNLSADTPINKAILLAGGLTLRANKNKIKLVRLNDNGTIQSKDYKYDLKINRSIDNPSLVDKDVIIVSTNKYSKLGDSLNYVINPLNPIIKGIRVYSLLD